MAAAMSMLRFSSQVSENDGRFCTVVLAKKDSQKRKLKAPSRREPVEFDQVKQDISSTERAVGQDIADEQRRTSSGSAVRASGDAANPTDLLEDGRSLVAERGAVLKACRCSSSYDPIVGISSRKSTFVFDLIMICYETNLKDTTDLWHVAPTVGVIVLVASLRQILLEWWPDFSESSQMANNQVLGSLKPVDFFTVSCLSGISEELLFRGALLPFLGPDWKGALGAGLIFGALHRSGGRNASFAAWASVVGVLYGLLGLYTSDLATPMAAHSAANLLGAGIWKLSQVAEESENSQRVE